MLEINSPTVDVRSEAIDSDSAIAKFAAKPMDVDPIGPRRRLTKEDVLGWVSSDAVPDEHVDLARRNLHQIIPTFEAAFQATKVDLFKARMAQVEEKIKQLRNGTAVELHKLHTAIDSHYAQTKEVMKKRMEFELEAENVWFLAEQQAASNNAQEELRIAESLIHDRLIEAMAEIQVQYQAAKRSIGACEPREEPLRQQNTSPSCNVTSTSMHKSRRRRSPSPRAGVSKARATATVPELDDLCDPTEVSEARLRQLQSLVCTPVELASPYLPGQDLEPRRKPVTLPLGCPPIIYELEPEIIEQDLDFIAKAVRERQINNAMKFLGCRVRDS